MTHPQTEPLTQTDRQTDRHRTKQAANSEGRVGDDRCQLAGGTIASSPHKTRPRNQRRHISSICVSFTASNYLSYVTEVNAGKSCLTMMTAP